MSKNEDISKAIESDNKQELESLLKEGTRVSFPLKIKIISTKLKTTS